MARWMAAASSVLPSPWAPKSMMSYTPLRDFVPHAANKPINKQDRQIFQIRFIVSYFIGY
jgi:hypothetical protein